MPDRDLVQSAPFQTDRFVTVLWTVLAGSFVIWNLVLAVWKRQKLFDLPRWTLFLPIAVLGTLGLVL